MSSPVPGEQVPGIYRHRVGDAVVTAISDGGINFPLAALQNIAPDEAQARLTAAGRTATHMTAINAFAVQTAARTVLIDTGAGPYMGPTGGRMLANLAAAEIAPEQVDVILMTHLHSDHTGGLLDASGKPVFPNAELFVPEPDAVFWLDEARAAVVPEAARGHFDIARAVAAAYGARLRLFTGGEPVAGITAVPLPGHTPGHTGYRIGSGADSLLIWGDILHLQDIQCRRPEVTPVFDNDPAAATATRRAVLARAADERLVVAGMHMHFPAFARIVRDGDAYAVQPIAWQRAL